MSGVVGGDHLDLFSGIGGFAIAARNCGLETIGFCEKEPYAQQILKERFGAVLADALRDRDNYARRGKITSQEGAVPGEKQQRERVRANIGQRHSPRLHSDIFTIDGGDYAGVYLLTGGFPCQPFSVAGKRRGAADDRALWPEMLRVIDQARPRWVLGENVAGIVTMELDNILSDLEGIGYAAWPLVIPACAVDARHRRDRVWIVAHSAQWKDNRRNGGSVAGEERRRECIDAALDAGGEDVADTTKLHRDERGKHRQPSKRQVSESGTCCSCEWQPESLWFAESGMGRVAHGIPNRAHRLRGLGNAIVPQVAEEIIRAIVSSDLT